MDVPFSGKQTSTSGSRWTSLELPQPAKGEKTARRVLRLLSFISQQGKNVTAKKIAYEMGVSLPTAYNLINSLIHEGYVERVPGGKGYRLGPMVALLYQRYLGEGDLIADLDPVVEELAERTGQRAYLGLYEDGELVVVQVKHMPGSRKVPGLDGELGDAEHALALGKVMLANISDEKVEDWKERNDLKAFTSRTITDPHRLDGILANARAEGFAIDLEEFVEGFCCVAAPVYSMDGKVEAALGISSLSRRFRTEARSFVHSVLEAGREASVIRGYAAQN